MRYINVRTFYRDFFNEVKDLPITITKYGQPQFIISSVGDNPKVPEKISKKFPEEEHNEELSKRCGVRGCLEYGDKCLFKGEETYLCKEHRARIFRGPDSRQLKVL